MHVDLQIVPKKVADIAKKMSIVTKQIENALESDFSLDLFSLFPGGLQLDNDLISACRIAIKSCESLIALGDKIGSSARLQRLGADLTSINHEEDHSISHYVKWFEIVFHDLFGKEK